MKIARAEFSSQSDPALSWVFLFLCYAIIRVHKPVLPDLYCDFPSAPGGMHAHISYSVRYRLPRLVIFLQQITAICFVTTVWQLLATDKSLYSHSLTGWENSHHICTKWQRDKLFLTHLNTPFSHTTNTDRHTLCSTCWGVQIFYTWL